MPHHKKKHWVLQIPNLASEGREKSRTSRPRPSLFGSEGPTPPNTLAPPPRLSRRDRWNVLRGGNCFRARASQMPRWPPPHLAQNYTGTPQTAQTHDHEPPRERERAWVGAGRWGWWSVGITPPPGRVAPSRWTTGLPVSARPPSICTQPASDFGGRKKGNHGS